MLHAFGQPLTVLGGYRLLARIPDSAEPHLLEELADQVDRANDLYEAMRLLLAGEEDRISAGVITEEWQRQVPRTRIYLSLDEANGAGDVRVLEGVFRTALRSCAPPSRPSVHVRDGWLEVDGGDALTSAVPWMLRVAEAVAGAETEAEGGETGMVYRLQPFHARVRLDPV